jgi:DNA-binding FadR family transcriptional regulator/bacterioferritin-associated ferredoxin
MVTGVIVCHCAAVNDQRIRALVAEGADDLLAVASACGAGSFCGGCAPVLASLLAEETGQPAASFLQGAPITAGDSQPVLFRRRADAVVRDLLEDVVAAGWPVGDELGSDVELAERYDVTPGTVREAVRLLAHHGLIDADGVTLRVGAPTPSTIGEAAAIHLHHIGVGLHEVVEARRTIEEIMVRRAAETTSAEATLEGRSDDHAEFHLALAERSGNPAFGVLVEALIRLARDLVPTGAGAAFAQREEQTAAEHREIADAVAAGDAERASRAMTGHLDAFYAAVPADSVPVLAVPARRRAHEGERPAAVLARSIALDIRTGGVGAGELLGTERDLALRYGVSRTELRQASSLLELYSVAYPRAGPRGGLVVGSPDMWGVAQLMARYLDFTRIEVHHIAEVRYGLELRAVELASERLDSAGAQRLRRRLDEEVVARSRGPVGSHGFHNVHPFIAELSGNRVLALFTSALILTLVRRVRIEAPPAALAAREQEVASAHAGIVDAMVAGDRELARERMLAHLSEHMRLSEQGGGSA